MRQGNTRGLFEGRSVVSVLTGEPEYLEPLGDETPQGWLVTGYPVDSVTDPANTPSSPPTRSGFNQTPKMGSVVGYALIHSIVAGIVKAGAPTPRRYATPCPVRRSPPRSGQ